MSGHLSVSSKVFYLNIVLLFQHLEIMMWCVKHRFLADVTSRYVNFTSWHSSVRQRKSVATKRAWFDAVNYSAESTVQEGSLFVEDALANLEIEQEFEQGRGEELELASLHKDDGGLSSFKFRIEGLSNCYPFENLRAAVDILFLHGSSDLVVAKQAIVSFLHFKLLFAYWMILLVVGILNQEMFLYFFLYFLNWGTVSLLPL